MRKSLVSIVALGLFAGAPVMAQTTMTEATKNTTEATTTEATKNTTEATKNQTQQQSQQQGTQQQTMGTQQTGTLGAEQFEQMLSEYEARAEVEARIVRAITPEGNQVLVLVGPRNFEPGGSVAAQDSDVRERFQDGRFSDVVILGEPTIFRADLDEDHYIFALSADQILRFGVQTGGLTGDTGGTSAEMQMDPENETSAQSGGKSGTTTGTQTGQTGTSTGTQMGQTGTDTGTQTGQTGTDTGSQTGTDTGTQTGKTGTQTGQTGTGTDTGTQMGQTGTGTETGQIGRALSEPDTDRIVSNLEEAGLEDASEFQGRLVKATGENDAPVFFVITSKDMESGAEIDINEDDVRQKLEDSGLEDVQFIDNAQIVRGNLEDDHVFVLAGDLFGQGGQQQ